MTWRALPSQAQLTHQLHEARERSDWEGAAALEARIGEMAPHLA